MKKLLYNHRLTISLLLLIFSVDIIWTHIFTNGKTTIWIYFNKWVYYRFHTLAPIYAMLIVAHLYNILFQWYEIKEESNYNDDILDL